MKIGSLFSGYGGLDMGVRAVIDSEVAWHVEFDAAPSAILAHHSPDVPNYGDITAVDWSSVEPVDILTGGFPCQDVSLAGARRGLRDGTRSGLWANYAEAIDVLRPSLVVIENVRGLLSADAHSDLEPCPWCVGDDDGKSALRALGAVLGDLADLGYDARWCGLRAADAGAPHARYRIFILAHPFGDEPERWRGLGDLGSKAGSGEGKGDQRQRIRHAALDRGATAPDAYDFGEHGARSARDGRSKSPNGRDVDSDASGIGRHEGRAESARVEGRPNGELGGTRDVLDWGAYRPAIERWERVSGRSAPAPTIGGRLAPSFVEWMMGLPPGWVTSPDIGITRTSQLKALGNGVVPQQAELALRSLVPYTAVSGREDER